MKIIPVLHNIRSTYNVGAILRTAEGLGIKNVVSSGYTPCYDDCRQLPHLREKINRQITKSALGAERILQIDSINNLIPWLRNRKLDGRAMVVGLENNLAEKELERRILLGSRDSLDPLIKADTVIVVLGEEVAGIPEDIRTHCDYFLEIPMKGSKESFNVSVAAAIALWELTK